jgi:prepilin-type processing-associated H-X9-DG protein
MSGTKRCRRRGATPAEVLTVFVILSFLFLIVLMTLPRQRENSRMAGCRRNLMQIGAGLTFYDARQSRLPTTPELGTTPDVGASPLRSLLETLALPDLTELTQDGPAPHARAGSVPGERPVPGFVCFSDANASAGRFPAPVSYRACTGDQPAGVNGAFAPGRRVRFSDVEGGDGRAYCAAFSERSLGNGRDDVRALENYASVPGPVPDGGCGSTAAARWRGDAGSSWPRSDWRSTLYNHVLTPGAAASCIAEDGKTAAMGASSGHTQGVNVLFLDGSVRTVSRTVAPPVWRAMATTNSPDAERPE